MKEILSTEETYVCQLEELEHLIISPLRTVLSDEQISSLFQNVGQIRGLHHELFAALSDRVAKWSVHQTIGDVFLKILPFMKIYAPYSANFEASKKMTATLKQDAGFKTCLNVWWNVGSIFRGASL